MAKRNDDDPVKKIFGKSTKEIFDTPSPDKSHSDFHSANAFCGNAGPEEMKHYYELMSKLTTKEVFKLAKRLGFPAYDDKDSGVEEFRDGCIAMLDEADREDFYREYSKIIKERKK